MVLCLSHLQWRLYLTSVHDDLPFSRFRRLATEVDLAIVNDSITSPHQLEIKTLFRFLILPRLIERALRGLASQQQAVKCQPAEFYLQSTQLGLNRLVRLSPRPSI